MTARVGNQHSHIAMTATIFNHDAQEPMLAQTGGNDQNPPNLFAQTQPETSEMSKQSQHKYAEYAGPGRF